MYYAKIFTAAAALFATATAAAADPFVCTQETVGQCGSAVMCSGSQTFGCDNGKCVCIVPELPPPTTLSREIVARRPDPTPALAVAKTPMAVGQRVCNDASVYTGPGDIHHEETKRLAMWICRGELGPDSPPLVAQSKSQKVPYFMSVSWMSGCETTVDRQNVGNPLLFDGATDEQKDIWCTRLLIDNWGHCKNNQGRGGVVTAGCLRYEFTPKE
ncbi:hypothetical protein CkaCkLH20_07257 [Colletotrichum karsti]|uniref:Secreted protein n=1 Tax=Colletotrichum karsti TaxID=1095194 RepID=A0A9P6I453_9PEZI|nr:uncharacterized protein CkaCkLH20_07257 [Colletotrichum karsti]KAF9875437.1 hypothetical protein CkaCkLH20_07257 [Colletotrichum karsti]